MSFQWLKFYFAGNDLAKFYCWSCSSLPPSFPNSLSLSLFLWQDLTMQPWQAWNSLDRPDWPWTQRIPTSTFQVPGLKACAITLASLEFLIVIVINYFLSWHMPVATLEAGAGSLEPGSLKAVWAMWDNILFFLKKNYFLLIFVSRIPATLTPDVF